jgi:transcriptional regulator with XRE-family HTH domain
MADNKKKRKTSLDALLPMAKRADLLIREADEERSKRPSAKFGTLHNEPELHLGDRLQEARREAGLTQGELAEKTKLADIDGVGISSSVISLYERGVNRPGPREIRILCESLRTTPNNLIYGEEDPFEPLDAISRYWGGIKTEGELYAAMTYCFSRLHKHHKSSIMELMMAILRGWEKNFDNDLHANAEKIFLQYSDELRLELAKRQQEQK